MAAIKSVPLTRKINYAGLNYGELVSMEALTNLHLTPRVGDAFVNWTDDIINKLPVWLQWMFPILFAWVVLSIFIRWLDKDRMKKKPWRVLNRTRTSKGFLVSTLYHKPSGVFRLEVHRDSNLVERRTGKWAFIARHQDKYLTSKQKR